MPRPRKVSNGDEVTISPSPRKRVKKPRTASNGEVVSSTPRQRTVKAATVAPDSSTTKPERKAPTPVAARAQVRRERRKQLVVIVSVACIVAGIGVAVGFSDRGVIDVVALTTEQNERIERGEVRDSNGDTITGLVPVQNIGNVPNGGLKIDESAVTPPAEPTVPSPIATSSDATATTTESATTNDVATSSEDAAI